MKVIISYPFHIYPGVPQPNDRIIGGFIVNITQVPWQAGLIFFGHEQRCGGSIIGNRWILTTAHCLDGLSPSEYKVLVGTSDKLFGGKIYDVEAHWLHYNYGPSSPDNDFGLIKLKDELSFNERVQPIPLPMIDDVDPEVGTKVLVSGWGKTQSNGDSQRLLRAVALPTVDRNVCNKAYKGLITDRMFCAGEREGGKGG